MQTITVGPGGSYKTIQSAVNAAPAGSIILVSSGTYSENVILTKAVTVNAAATVDGFTVRNSSQSNSGIIISASGATVANNKVSGCGWGIFLESGTGSTVKGNNVDGASNAGITIRSSSKNTLTGNKVTSSGKGLNIEGSSTGNVIYLNDFNNGYSSGGSNTFYSPVTRYTYHGNLMTNYLGNHWGD